MEKSTIEILRSGYKYICPKCLTKFGTKFKCDHCGEVFCDCCESKISFDVTRTPLLVQFFCPSCNSIATRIPYPCPEIENKNHIID